MESGALGERAIRGWSGETDCTLIEAGKVNNRVSWTTLTFFSTCSRGAGVKAASWLISVKVVARSTQVYIEWLEATVFSTYLRRRGRLYICPTYFANWGLPS